MLKTHKIPIIIAISLFVILIAVVAILPVATMENAFDYTTVNFNGIDGYGSANVVLDKSSIIEAVLGEQPDNYEDLVEYGRKYEQFWDGIECTYSPEENLSNGDKVTVKIKVSGIAESKISGGTKTFVVEGLPEGIPLDVFAGFTYSVDGINGSGTLDFEEDTSNGFIEKGYFSADKTSNLSNGDEVTITFEFNVENSINYGYVPITTTKTITVSGLGSYLNNVKDLPKETLKTIADTFLAEETEDNKDDWIFSYSNFKYYKSWLLYALEDKYTGNVNNQLVVCVCYDEYFRGAYQGKTYSFYEYDNIVVSADGTVNIRYDLGYSNTFSTDIENSIENWQEKFTVTEIPNP